MSMSMPMPMKCVSERGSGGLHSVEQQIVKLSEVETMREQGAGLGAFDGSFKKSSRVVVVVI